ncbi:nuclear nucleic acid-binding protein C1D [Drosophila mauritiana]|uniref:Nuclear nucleic acid-binding protein C1D n=1 Tax=Drosophila mauritiana TaxID=7226 RepID=A0A6P8KNL4_DROMA|nr:nuclear nucleic acid-binding protein C1D [Drosophila mauritiana]
MAQENQAVDNGLHCNAYLDTSLQKDENVQRILKTFYSSIEILEAETEKTLAIQAARTLNTNEQIKLDSYLVYLNSTLFFIYQKLQGVDVSNHAVMHDLRRTRDLLARDKEINEALAAPRLDMPAAKRFIAAGTHTRFVDMNGVMVTEKQYNKSKEEAPK